MSHEKIIAQRGGCDLVKQSVGNLMKIQVVSNHCQSFLGVADIHFGVKLKPAQRRLGDCVMAGESAGDLARAPGEHKFKAHSFEQHGKTKLA